MIGSLINVALGGYAYTVSKCGDSDPGACSRRAYDIGSPRTESLNSSNIVGSNIPLGWGNPFSRLGSIGDIGDTLNKLPSLGLVCDSPFLTRLGENAGDEFSAVPHGNVGEGDEDDGDDHPNDGSNSEDSDKSPAGDFFDVSFPSLPPRTGAVTTGAPTLISVADIPTLSVGGSTSAFIPCCTQSWLRLATDYPVDR